jgi:hypothetical protein
VSRSSLERQRQFDKETHRQALENLQTKFAAHDVRNNNFFTRTTNYISMWQAEQMQARKREQDEFKSSLESSKSKMNSLRKDLQERKDEIAKLSFAEAELKQVGFSLILDHFHIIILLYGRLLLWKRRKLPLCKTN